MTDDLFRGATDEDDRIVLPGGYVVPHGFLADALPRMTALRGGISYDRERVWPKVPLHRLAWRRFYARTWRIRAAWRILVYGDEDGYE